VGQVGEQSFHIGRNAVLASRLPDSVPAVTIDRQCGSSQPSPNADRSCALDDGNGWGSSPHARGAHFRDPAR
jgi:hypothetical protein